MEKFVGPWYVPPNSGGGAYSRCKIMDDNIFSCSQLFPTYVRILPDARSSQL